MVCSQQIVAIVYVHHSYCKGNNLVIRSLDLSQFVHGKTFDKIAQNTEFTKYKTINVRALCGWVG